MFLNLVVSSLLMAPLGIGPLVQALAAPLNFWVQDSAETQEESDSLPDPGDRATRQALAKFMAEHDIVIDYEKGSLSFPAVIIRDEPNGGYPIEFGLVTNGGKTHETPMITRVVPSVLNAALLSLGLTPGRTIRFVPKDPMPTQKAIMSGKESPYDIVLPQGTVLFLYLRYENESGETVTVPFEDVLIDLRTGEKLPVRGFVYIGSRFSRARIHGEVQEAYIADLEGNIIAIYLRGDGGCVFDINSEDGVGDEFVDVNAEVMPALETKVEIVVTQNPIPGLRAPESDVIYGTKQLNWAELAEAGTHSALKGADVSSFEGMSFAEVASAISGKATPAERTLAAALIGATQSPGATKPLLDALKNDADPPVRQAAREALVVLGNYDAIRGFIDFLSDDDETVKKLAHDGLVEFSGESLPADRKKWNTWVTDNIDRFR